MIRKKQPVCKLKFSNISLIQQYECFKKSFVPELERCPSCGARGNCRCFATYTRSVFDFQENKIVSFSLDIQRVICTCGHTHGVIPDSLIPYSQFSLAFVLHVLHIYFSGASTIEEICKSYDISPTTLYRWKNTFLHHKTLWLGFVSSGVTPALAFLDSLFAMEYFSDFSMAYHQKTLFSFLQSHQNPANCGRRPAGWPSS